LALAASWGLGIPAGTDAVTVDLRAGIFGTEFIQGTINSVEEVIGSGGDDIILGKWTSDYLMGAWGNDFIAGRNGDDRLDGGVGADVLHGGPGADQFIFNDIQTEPYDEDSFIVFAGPSDLIQDFTPGTDKLSFEDGAFGTWRGVVWNGTEWAVPEWGAAEDWFYAASGATSSHDASDRLVYDTASGNLYYDFDGDGETGAIQVAQLVYAPALTADDILI
jgi:serralysin